MRTKVAELVRTAAATLLAHRDAGRCCDPHSVRWAEQMLAANPDAGPRCDDDEHQQEEEADGSQPF